MIYLRFLVHTTFVIIGCGVLFIPFTVVSSLKSGSKREQNEEQSLFDFNHFGSLLGSGRELSFPFGSELIFALVNENTWNISHQGFEDVFGENSIPQKDSTLLNILKNDSNITFTSTIYATSGSALRTSSNLENLQTDIKLLKSEGTGCSWDAAWKEMHAQIANNTFELLDGELIPTGNPLGILHDLSTQSTILNTFHYKNNWKYEWSETGMGEFVDSGEVAYMETEGLFLKSENEDFTATSVPLEGSKQSIIFVLPRSNITKRKVVRGESSFLDEIPFPDNWVSSHMRVKAPKFNLTKLEQYGKEFLQLGINETFCTTIIDNIGRLPYYLRPIVQVNYADFNTESLELASATGTAVEKFILGADIQGLGYPRYENPAVRDANLENRASLPLPTSSKLENQSSTSEDLVLNRPFVWYLNDEIAGPLFFGFTSDLKEKTNQTAWHKDILKIYLWSCKSFMSIPPVTNH